MVRLVKGKEIIVVNEPDLDYYLSRGYEFETPVAKPKAAEPKETTKPKRASTTKTK